MKELWKDIEGFEGRYQVSNLGRVKSLPFKQRYLLKTGVEAYRVTPERILSTQKINSGYLIVHLHLDNKRKACTIHRLVAKAFVPGAGRTVNHIDGIKTNNTVANLEWVSYSRNLLHAVDLRLNRQAVPIDAVIAWGATRRYPSMAQASRETGRGIGTIARSAKTSTPDKHGTQWVFA